MNKTNLALFILVICILSTNVLIPAHAIYLTAVINTKEKFAEPVFKFEKSVFVKYPDGGKIADMLREKDIHVQFSANSTTPGVSELITKLNESLKRIQSNAVVTDLKIDYVGYLEQGPDSTVINYKISLIPTITNYILREGTKDVPTLIDSQWRGISVDGPVIIHDEKLGDVDINSLIGFFKVALPDVYGEILGTPAESFLSTQVINAKPILSQSITNWLHLFDPLGILVETEKFGYNGERIPITTFSMGESSLREGQQHPKIESVEFSKDKKYTINSIEYQSIGVIRINGIVRTDAENGIEYFGASDKPVEGYSAYSSGNFPVEIIYSMAGFAVVGGIVFFIISDRQLKKVKDQGQTGIDPSRLRAYQTSVSAGGYHTNRGEAQLADDSDYQKTRSVYDIQKQEGASLGSSRGAMPKDWRPEN